MVKNQVVIVNEDGVLSVITSNDSIEVLTLILDENEPKNPVTLKVTGFASGEAMEFDAMDGADQISPKITEEIFRQYEEAQQAGDYAECDNCGRRFNEDWIKPIHEVEDLFQRVAPGEVFPAGECRVCGALVHLIKRGEE